MKQRGRVGSMTVEKDAYEYTSHHEDKREGHFVYVAK